MRRAGLDGAMLVVWLGAVPVATPAFAASGKVAPMLVDLRQHPTGGKTPVEVSVGLYVTNFVAIE